MTPNMQTNICVGAKQLDDIIHWAAGNGQGLQFGSGKLTKAHGFQNPVMGWTAGVKHKL